MKVFYTDISKKSETSNLGRKFLKISGILFIVAVFIIIMSKIIFEIGTPEIIITVIIGIISLFLAVITFTVGLIISRKDFLGEENLKLFVYDEKQNLYIVDKDGISEDHFDAFRMSMINGVDAISILIAGLGILNLNKEKNKVVKSSRDFSEIKNYLEDKDYLRIKTIEVLNDNGRTIKFIMRTADDSRKIVQIGNNYNEYEELFDIVRKLGKK